MFRAVRDLRFLRVRDLMLGERMNGGAQYLAPRLGDRLMSEALKLSAVSLCRRVKKWRDWKLCWRRAASVIGGDGSSWAPCSHFEMKPACDWSCCWLAHFLIWSG
jgi:hypothetical protein